MNVGLFFITLLTFLTIAEASNPADLSKDIKHPSLEAIRLNSPIVIDGQLNEKEWQRAGITEFTQRNPNEGQPISEKTEVWVAYDDEAIYVAARLDDKPDSIISRTGRRDAFMNSDWFYFGIDSYHDQRTGFYFGVYPSGTVIDGTLYNDSWDDNSWDGVWEAKTQMNETGWTLEMKIPYSQLHFAKQDEYVWGVNFGRMIERKKEESYYVMVPKTESGWVSRFASLTGIKNISPPPRIEITPYVVSSTKITNQYDPKDPFNKGTTFTGNVGADGKFGLGSNFTLTATINPDFGQVEVDPAVVNLSQFETFFQEKRPFFVEGTSFLDFGYGGSNNNWGFNWGGPSYFYSRRIGRSPLSSEQHSGYADRPSNTTILGAAKLTGKIGDNFSLGGVSALTEREYSKIDDGNGNLYEDEIEPFTSYNVLRGSNEFNQGKQGLGFIATSVNRKFNQTAIQNNYNDDSYALGIDGWTNLDSAQTWVVTGWGAGSYIEGTAQRMINVQRGAIHNFQRPDITHEHVDSNATSLSGYAGRFALNKQKGNIKFNSAIGFISPGFETNDLGYLFRTDQINAHIVTGYRWYEPSGVFRNGGFNLATFRNYDFGGNKFGEGYFMFYDASFTNYWSLSGEFIHNPAVLDNRNTRGGPWMMTTNQYGTFIYINSDSRNQTIYSGGIDFGYSSSGGFRYSFYPSIELKPESNVNMTISPSYTRDVTMAQWVQKVNDASAIATYGSRYIFGHIDQHELSADIRLDWIFNPKLSLQLFVQPFISVGGYQGFKELKEPKTYSFNRYGEDNNSTVQEIKNPDGSIDHYAVDPDGTGQHNFNISNPDFNFKSLRGNAVLRWEYSPGSTIFFVWTQSRTNFNDAGTFDARRDFSNLITAPDHEDVFLVKFAYWWNP